MTKGIRIRIIGLLFISTTMGVLAFGQTRDTLFVFNPIIDDITLRIPPLDDLIDSAIVHSPEVKAADAEIYLRKYGIKSAQRDFLTNFYLDAGMNVFYQDALTSNRTNLGDINSVLSTQDNSGYALGISIRMPLDDLMDRRNRVKHATKFMEQAFSERDYQIRLLRRDIIIQYNRLIINQKILRIANDNQIYMSLQMALAEKEFLNGQISLYELARLNEMNRRAVTDFEQARNEFYNAYMILQEIVGIKFNVINNIE
ncbi:MAG: TolC family protein [Bacteroidales bacterium]|nr:TolC family protein [Bacteroidales bacterium]